MLDCECCCSSGERESNVLRDLSLYLISSTKFTARDNQSPLWSQELRNSTDNVCLIDYQFLYLADSLVAHRVNKTDLSKRSNGLTWAPKEAEVHRKKSLTRLRRVPVNNS